MTHPITASMLYNLMQCPTRVFLDLFEDQAKKDEVSKFVELLWERGTVFENEVIASLGIPLTDLRDLTLEEGSRRRRTLSLAVSNSYAAVALGTGGFSESPTCCVWGKTDTLQATSRVVPHWRVGVT